MGAVSRKALKIVRKSHPLPCQTTVQKNVGFLYVVPGYIVQNIEYVKYLQSQPGWSAADAMLSCINNLHPNKKNKDTTFELPHRYHLHYTEPKVCKTSIVLQI